MRNLLPFSDITQKFSTRIQFLYLTLGILLYRIVVYPNYSYVFRLRDDEIGWYQFAKAHGVGTVLKPDGTGYNIFFLRLVPLLSEMLKHIGIPIGISNGLIVQLLISICFASIIFIDRRVLSFSLAFSVALLTAATPIEDINYLQNFGYVLAIPMTMVLLQNILNKSKISTIQVFLLIFCIEKEQVAIYCLLLLIVLIAVRKERPIKSEIFLLLYLIAYEWLSITNPHTYQVVWNLSPTLIGQTILSTCYQLGLDVVPALSVGAVGFLNSHRLYISATICGFLTYAIGLLILLNTIRAYVRLKDGADQQPKRTGIGILILGFAIFWLFSLLIGDSYWFKFYPEYWKFTAPQHFWDRHSFLVLPFAYLLIAILSEKKRRVDKVFFIIFVQWAALLVFAYSKMNRYW